MKILRNKNPYIFGVKYSLFTVIFDDKSKQYCYYTNALGTNNLGDCLIYKGKTKSKSLNKYTMFIVGLFYTIYVYTLKWPIAIVSTPLFMYFDGCINFIKNRAWQNNVRFFNLMNIIILILLIIYIFIR